MKRSPRTRRRALSLVETLMSLTIGAMCLSVTTSTLYVVTSGSERLNRRSESHNSAGLHLHRLRNELSLATAVSSLTSSDITFSHPDLDGDGFEEDITYAWSGTPGDPLTRAINGDAAVAIMENCQDFGLSVLLQDPQEAAEREVTNEMVIAYHDNYPAGVFLSNVAYEVTNSKRVAEYFIPDYSEALSCRVTRVFFKVRRAGNGSGQVHVSIQSAGGGGFDPSGNVVENVAVEASNLPSSFNWHEFNFSDAVVPVGQPALVVARGTNSNSGELLYDQLLVGSYSDDMGRRYSGNGGTSWQSASSLTLEDLDCYIYGCYTLDNWVGTGVYESGFIKSIYWRLRIGDEEVALRFDGGATCLNKPPVAGLSVEDTPLRGG